MKIQDLAYVLHRRPYRETSFLVDFFTQQHGVVAAVCRGVRTNKHSRTLECFQPFWIEYDNRHNLATLYQWEISRNSSILLEGTRLFCGLYLNELLVRLLGKHDPYPEVFEVYQKTLEDLSREKHFEKTLRLFELYLLQETGYGIPLEKELEAHQPIAENKRYYYRPGVGFFAMNSWSSSNLPFMFEGKSLIAIAQNDFSKRETLQDAKQLIRLTLEALLEKKAPLKSRTLFLKKI